MQDINIIKKELIGFEEIKITYPLNKNCYIKYITLKDNNEFFYNGGSFEKYAFDKIILKKDNKFISVPTIYKDENGDKIYESRFFLKIENNNINHNEKLEYEKIIKNQQMIIEKLSRKLSKLS
tara:strand:+ start:220 stop:588 length:369 start_codon:yes stop_codon:yes gene_type:complete